MASPPPADPKHARERGTFARPSSRGPTVSPSRFAAPTVASQKKPNVVDRSTYTPNLKAPPMPADVFGVPKERIKAATIGGRLHTKAKTYVFAAKEDPARPGVLTTEMTAPLPSSFEAAAKRPTAPSAWARMSEKRKPIQALHVDPHDAHYEVVRVPPTPEEAARTKAAVDRLCQPKHRKSPVRRDSEELPSQRSFRYTTTPKDDARRTSVVAGTPRRGSVAEGGAT